MNVRWLGAALIFFGCGGYGFFMAAGLQQQVRLLNQLSRVLELMEGELQYRLTALPELCRLAARESGGILGEIFRDLYKTLSRQDQPDAAACMDMVLANHDALPVRLRRHLRQLGKSLGRFDLPGQLRGLEAVRRGCLGDLENLRKNRDLRVRSYQTLSLCAGAALVILFV